MQVNWDFDFRPLCHFSCHVIFHGFKSMELVNIEPTPLFNENTLGCDTTHQTDCLLKYGKIYQATTHKIKCLLCPTATEPTHTYQIRYILYV